MLLATDSACGAPSHLFIVQWAPVSWMYNAQPRNLATYFDDLVQSFGMHGAIPPLLETHLWYGS